MLRRPALRVDITRHIINTFIKLAVFFGFEDYPGAPWPQPFQPGDPVGEFAIDADTENNDNNADSGE